MTRRLETGERRPEQERDALVGLATAYSLRSTACGWGWRVWKASAPATLYLHGPGGQLLCSYSDTGGGTYTEPVSFAGRLVYTFRGGTDASGNLDYDTIRTDRLGSTRAVNGVARNYYPFGEEIGTPTANDQYKYASTYRDSATGLDYAVNRYYASGMGRFLTPDPYEAAGGAAVPQNWNRYSYVHNDPINYFDPLGTNEADPNASYQGGGLNPFGFWGYYIADPEGKILGQVIVGSSPVTGAVPSAPAAGGGGRLDTAAILGRAQKMIDKSKCADWLVGVAQDAFMTVSGKAVPEDLDPGARSYYDAITAENIMARLRSAVITDTGKDRKDAFGNDISALADYGNDGTGQSIQLFNPFFKNSLDGQAQTMLHEGLHLIFRLGDADLARAAGVYKDDRTASSRFSDEVRKNCN